MIVAVAHGGLLAVITHLVLLLWIGRGDTLHQITLLLATLEAEIQGPQSWTRKLEENNNFDRSVIQRLKHDLRNPLNIIIGFSTLLKEEQVGILNEKQRRYIENILNSTQSLSSLLKGTAESSPENSISSSDGTCSTDPLQKPQEIQS